MTSTTGRDRAAGAAGAADRDAPRVPARDRTELVDLPPAAPAAPMLAGFGLASASLAVLCVLAVLVPAPHLTVGPLVVPGGDHDRRVLVFLVLVTLAGSALGIGLVRGALPRAEAAGSSASVDRSALVVRPAWPALARVARGWAVVVLLVVTPAWLGLLPLPVVGLVLPFAVAACAPAVVVRRVAVAAAARRGLAVLAPGAGAALAGHLTVAGPVRAAPARVVLTGELLAPRPAGAGGGRAAGAQAGRAAGGRGGPAPGAAAGRAPGAGHWGFQSGPGD